MLSLTMYASLLLALQSGPVAPSAPAPAPALRAPIRVTANLVSQKPTTLGFSVNTSVGLVSGTIPVTRWISRGLDGRGRFVFEVEFDGSRAETGDDFTNRFIRENILPKRLLASGSGRTQRASEGENMGKLAIKTWIVVGRAAPKYREIYFSYEPKVGGGGFFSAQHAISFEALGLQKIPHPFVKTTGEITLELSARLVPETR